jgi:hypothetical protein
MNNKLNGIDEELNDLIDKIDNINIKENTKKITDIQIMGEIYMATCRTTKLSYIGQTRTHRKNNDKYNKFGSYKRWQGHLQEARNNPKNQSTYLNNAIRKYSEDDWDVVLLKTCEVIDLDTEECFHIKEYNTLYPNGYNLTGGGKGGSNISLEQCRRISETVKEVWQCEV